jgi:hypothetical protein
LTESRVKSLTTFELSEWSNIVAQLAVLGHGHGHGVFILATSSALLRFWDFGSLLKRKSGD